MSHKTLDFYFDFGSPAAYLAWTQVSGLCAQTQARLTSHPMLLGGVFKATGNHSPAQIPAKHAYIFQDFQRFAKRYGVPLNRNPHFPVNTLLLMRAATGLQMDGLRYDAYCQTIFQAMWVDARDLNDPAVIAQVLQASGFQPADLLQLASRQDVKDRLRAVTEEAVARGVFGAPTFFVDEQMFWGQDRLDFVREALQE